MSLGAVRHSPSACPPASQRKESERDELAAGAERTGDMPTIAGMWGTGAGRGEGEGDSAMTR